MKPATTAEIEYVKKVCSIEPNSHDIITLRIIAAYEAEKARADRAVDVLKQVEWSGPQPDVNPRILKKCPCCGGINTDIETVLNELTDKQKKSLGHKGNCFLAAALKEAEQK